MVYMRYNLVLWVTEKVVNVLN